MYPRTRVYTHNVMHVRDMCMLAQGLEVTRRPGFQRIGLADPLVPNDTRRRKPTKLYNSSEHTSSTSRHKPKAVIMSVTGGAGEHSGGTCGGTPV